VENDMSNESEDDKVGTQFQDKRDNRGDEKREAPAEGAKSTKRSGIPPS
jgi:hypothetical protein